MSRPRPTAHAARSQADAHTVVFVVVLLALLGVVALMAEPAAEWLRDRGRDNGVATAPPAHRSAPATPVADPGALGPSPTVTPTVTPTSPATIPPTVPSTAPASTSSPPMTPAVPLTTIQTVPPVRDFVIQVNGRSLSTDGSGRIELASTDRAGTLQVVGIIADPPVQRFDFTGWSDGSTSSTRALDSFAGPSVQVGLEVKSRVIVNAEAVAASPATVRFVTQGGPVVLTADEPQWVVSSRAVPGDGGLVAQSLTYALDTVTVDGSPVTSAPAVFVPSPEALWVVTA